MFLNAYSRSVSTFKSSRYGHGNLLGPTLLGILLWAIISANVRAQQQPPVEGDTSGRDSESNDGSSLPESSGLTEPKLLRLITDQAVRVKLKCVPAVAYCERVAVPTVVGVLRPMVLLPVSLMTGLTPDDFAAIIRHEYSFFDRYYQGEVTAADRYNDETGQVAQVSQQ